jgi:hypothetical protein
MNTPHSDSSIPEEPLGFDSRDSEIFIVDGPGDTTIRPASQHLLPFLLAEREKLTRYQEMLEQSTTADKPPKGTKGPQP